MNNSTDDRVPLFSARHPLPIWYKRIWNAIQYFFIRPKFSKEALEPIEEKFLAVLHTGMLEFQDITKEKIPYREVEGIGYQWFRESDKTWQPLSITGEQITFIDEQITFIQ